jgi:hypothetical protein
MAGGLCRAIYQGYSTSSYYLAECLQPFVPVFVNSFIVLFLDWLGSHSFYMPDTLFLSLAILLLDSPEEVGGGDNAQLMNFCI